MCAPYKKAFSFFEERQCSNDTVYDKFNEAKSFDKEHGKATKIYLRTLCNFQTRFSKIRQGRHRKTTKKFILLFLKCTFKKVLKVTIQIG